MCFGGGNNSSSSSSEETFNSAVDIYHRFKYNSRITSNQYIDPLGYEYVREQFVGCYKCMFNANRYDGCIIYKEKSWTDNDIKSQRRNVSNEHYCDYFLIKDFSEGDDEDEIAKIASRQIQERLYT